MNASYITIDYENFLAQTFNTRLFFNTKISRIIYDIVDLDMQNTVDEVQVLIRKHEDFEATTQAHDERIKQLNEQANRLIHGGHYDIPRLVAAYHARCFI